MIKGKYFTKKESVVLTEIYRRLNCFHNGNLDASLLLLSTEAECRCVVQLGLIERLTCGTVKKGCLGWFKLTDLGKKFFSNYVETISNEMNLTYFDGRDIKYFSKDFYKSLV